MAKILLIETATEVCSVAVSVDGEVVALEEQLECSSHAAALTLQMDACARRSGVPLAALDAVAVSKGPGAYTSLRVGASAAKGICYALEKPLIAVDTLAALALGSQSALGNSLEKESLAFLPMLDARRDEVWLAAYDDDMGLLLPAQPFVFGNNSLDGLLETLGRNKGQKRWVLSGNGAFKAGSGSFSAKKIFSPVQKNSARFLADFAENFFQIGDFQEVAYFEPFYMKPPNITEAAKKI